ncbi:MAG: ShlB/FhaC/HecB family hemolysin secretion/activation protein [Scytolyngbya sp. HA4215-MV1]|nr:ShlB/FhaC/HecB family hemolysin secretion/activation protein [Scytolyngbya sp. HA4215-MV1]
MIPTLRADRPKAPPPSFEPIASRPPIHETSLTTASQSIPIAAQPDPSDRLPPPEPFFQTAPPPNPPVLTPAPPPASPPPSVPESPAFPNAIPVRDIQITGSTILSATELNPLTQPLKGRSVALTELQALTDHITQLYLNQGYITSRAILDKAGIQEGVVPIQVVEGSLEKIDIEGTHHVKSSYIRKRVKLGAGKPLNMNKLEDQLKLLRADPLFKNVEASLRAGTQFGKSILIVRVTEANRFEGSVSTDNYSPPSVGGEQFGVDLSFRNLTGLGDQVSTGYSRTYTGGSESFDWAYRIPLNAMNGTLQLRGSWNHNEITASPFDVLEIRGNSELYEINYRQPLVRSPREEFALSLGFAFQDGQTFIFNDLPNPFGIGPDANGVSRTSVIKFGQDYLKRDAAGAWSLRSQFSIGTDLFDATENAGDIPDGQFFSWLGQAQRVQRLSTDHLLIVQADVQLTPDGLLPSQQFVIGGGQSVRGYRQNARSGDNGIRLSAEDRITVHRDANGSPIVQFAPFAELGAVWNVGNNPNLEPDQTFLASIGLGLLWQPLPRLSVRLDYGLPIIHLSDRGNNIQDSGAYFSLNYQL